MLLLLILIYSILGVYFFSEIKLNGALNDNVNFQSVSMAFLTLIRVLTGEKWPELLEAMSRKNDQEFQCISNPTYKDYVANGCKLYCNLINS